MHFAVDAQNVRDANTANARLKIQRSSLMQQPQHVDLGMENPDDIAALLAEDNLYLHSLQNMRLITLIRLA